jgi:hypothetical protein
MGSTEGSGIKGMQEKKTRDQEFVYLAEISIDVSCTKSVSKWVDYGGNFGSDQTEVQHKQIIRRYHPREISCLEKSRRALEIRIN